MARMRAALPRTARRRRRCAPAVALVVLAAFLTPGLGAPVATAAATAPAGACSPTGTGWSASSTSADRHDGYDAFTGNGYLGQRVPANGTGYAATGEKTGWPLYTPQYDGSFVAGLYAHNPQTTDDRQVIAALPTWSGLTVGAGEDTFTSDTAADRISHYRQTVLFRCGLVRTALTWTASDGRSTDLVFDVFASRERAHTAAVRLRMTPHWSGEATVTDLIDGRGARRLAPTGTAAGPGGSTMTVGFRADGTGTTGAIASTLTAGPSVHVRRHRPAGTANALTARQSVVFPVHAATTYTLTKYVGVDTALTADLPRPAAVAASRDAAAHGWRALFAAHAAAWTRLWSAGVEVRGHPELQAWIRSSEYGLLSAVRPGSADSIAPTGLTSDNYAGEVFWDADTWMFPALLATQPELARSVVDYRYRTRAAARANARRLGYPGLFYSWTSGSTGDLDECHSWGPPPQCVTQVHLQGDVALAVWQYYEATGDLAWLRTRGWPVLEGIAQFWTGRVRANADGSYSVTDISGPDEYSNGVTDGAFTNAGAATALRNATRAARLLGHRPPAAWSRIADGLRVPYDADRQVFEQYDGYDGSTIKQADTVMLRYPLQWAMTPAQASATLDYYAARTDPDGPAMTDAIHAIDAAELGEPGCVTYTYLLRAVEPFVRAPFDEFSEARGTKAGTNDPLAGAPAQDFLTGAGGFLQTFSYGLAGLRWTQDGVRLDPLLPPQLADGVTLRGLRWHGSTFDVAIGPRHTTVRPTHGGPVTVETASGSRTATVSEPLVLPTRRPDLTTTTDVARCAAATATSEQPGMTAKAAVDGSRATSWAPASSGGDLTVDLGRVRAVGGVRPQWTADAPPAYAVSVSADGRHWRPADDVSPGHTLRVRYVRVAVPQTRDGTGLAELEVTGG